MDAIESYERGACVVEIHYDEDPMSPREWTQLGTIVTWGRDRGWGDETLKYEPYDTDYSTARWAVGVRRERGATVVIPIAFHDYGSGGNALNVCDWDDANGVIFDTPKGREETGCTDIRAGLLAEVEEMRQYVNGEAYGYVVKRDGVVVDSCWGFLGDDGLAEARSQADVAADHETAMVEGLGFYEMAH